MVDAWEDWEGVSSDAIPLKKTEQPVRLPPIAPPHLAQGDDVEKPKPRPQIFVDPPIAELVLNPKNPNNVAPKGILKRKAAAPDAQRAHQSAQPQQQRVPTAEERESQYDEARRRIFNGK